MPRLMSVALTEQAVITRRKLVTRRLGWWEDKNGRRLLHPGDRLTLCRKVQGRGPGEPLVRITDVEVVNVHREPLRDITPDDVLREGFPGWTPVEFVRFFTAHMGCQPEDLVTRICWRYLDWRQTLSEVHDPIDVDTALDLIGRQRRGDAPPVATCRGDGEPLVCTFEFPGAEFYCVVCGAKYGFLGPKAAESTPEIEARLDELNARYEVERAERAATQGGAQ